MEHILGSSSAATFLSFPTTLQSIPFDSSPLSTWVAYGITFCGGVPLSLVQLGFLLQRIVSSGRQSTPFGSVSCGEWQQSYPSPECTWLQF